ncbi:MAG TPA: YggS family pyridoxal phosphate-dependent enzyme [Anaerolineae bacterium]|nr:YggS family pyridoxal phosphate-dependent enzyme [Anaerolineae bacterium]
MDAIQTLSENLKRVQNAIGEAALRAGRRPESVRLVAVTKTFPPAAIRSAWELGQRDFGENRPEEGAAKIPEVQSMLGTMRPIWHMIGPIQRRKAPLVVAHFDFIHSVDRPEIAQKLNTLAVAAGKVLPILLECNISGESSKHGYPVAGWEQDETVRAAFYAAVAAVGALPGLRLSGLMTMAPIVPTAEDARPIFTSLRALRDALRERFPEQSLEQLSMGMSDDFPVAVEEGATLVRVGRAIFGDYHRD